MKDFPTSNQSVSVRIYGKGSHCSYTIGIGCHTYTYVCTATTAKPRANLIKNNDGPKTTPPHNSEAATLIKNPLN